MKIKRILAVLCLIVGLGIVNIAPAHALTVFYTYTIGTANNDTLYQHESATYDMWPGYSASISAYCKNWGDQEASVDFFDWTDNNNWARPVLNYTGTWSKTVAANDGFLLQMHLSTGGCQMTVRLFH